MIITVDKEYFDIKATLECGQFFRYERCGDGGYFVHSLDKRCYLRELGGVVEISSDDISYFKKFFDLDTDYSKIVKTLSDFPEISVAVENGKGIRILRQSLFETVISFIISANNNITRIKGIIERLCRECGTKMDGYYAFPTADQLKKLSVDRLKELGLGYRAPYIYKTCREFPLREKEISSITDAVCAHKALLSFTGIGPKVADCILLFGMHLTRSYPVDTWIFKANRTDELNTPQKVRDYYLNRYGEYAGFAQQYSFYYARENKIE